MSKDRVVPAKHEANVPIKVLDLVAHVCNHSNKPHVLKADSFLGLAKLVEHVPGTVRESVDLCLTSSVGCVCAARRVPRAGVVGSATDIGRRGWKGRGQVG